MRKKDVRALILCMAVFIVGCGEMCADTPRAENAFNKAPDFKLTDISGKTVRLSDYSGKVIILNFFTTWCPPCRREMPDFDEIAKEYKNDVAVIAVNLGGENPETVREFARSNNLNFPIVLDNGTTAKLYGPITAIPVTVIIDRNFGITRKYVGRRTKEALIGDIEKLL